MHKIGIFSDPHIGLVRRSHTTPSSRKSLTGTLSVKASEAADLCNDRADITLCLGDLFDKSHNDEVTILQGLSVASKCNLVLEGNHDVPNREGTKCSTNVLSEVMTDCSIVSNTVGSVYVSDNKFGDVNVVSVPHHSSQQLFDEALQAAIDVPAKEDELEIMITHCNYECGYADNEISLNLTSEMADKLLDRFDYVFIGHEHESRELKDGRLIIVGNTHPTSFSDISDKYVWFINEDNEVVKEQIWSQEQNFRNVNYGSEDLEFKAQFISVNGDVSAEEYSNVTDYMVKLWAANPDALMIRNNIKVIESNDTQEDALKEMDNLPGHISEELKDSKLLPLWNGYVERVNDRN